MVALVFIFGLLVGSFLNVCISRLPAGESVVFPPSRCPRCGRRLAALELVPALSFICLRGRCRGCAGQIPLRYPAVELLCAVVFVLLYRRFTGVDFALQAVFYSILLVVLFIDLERQVIPNRLVLLLSGFALLMQLTRPGMPLREALAGALLGGGLFLFLAVVSGGGMGGGDVKLMAVLGFWFGWRQALLLMFFAFVAGGVVGGLLMLAGLKKRKDAIPFAPFMVLAAFVTGMWGASILEWYMRQSGVF